MVLRYPTRVYQSDRASRTPCRTATNPADHNPNHTNANARNPQHTLDQPLSISGHACPVLGRAVGIRDVARLEEITYEAGRHALADQEALASGIRQRTGTLLAAHALVASFLGATVIRAYGLDAFGWIALGALVLGLGIAAVLLAPWPLKFSIG